MTHISFICCVSPQTTGRSGRVHRSAKICCLTAEKGRASRPTLHVRRSSTRPHPIVQIERSSLASYPVLSEGCFTFPGDNVVTNSETKEYRQNFLVATEDPLLHSGGKKMNGF